MIDNKIVNIINYWKSGSDKDFQSVEDIANNTSSFIQALFFLHLSIEKALKAYYVFKFQTQAPFAHGLIYLAEKCELELIDNDVDTLVEINQFNLQTRYPDESYSLEQKATKQFTLNKIQTGKVIRTWILEKLKN